MSMVNELSFTRFKSSIIESLKGLCEHGTSFAKVLQSLHACNKTMKLPSPSSETSVSPKRLIELSTRRKVVTRRRTWG